jgi:hypothetical protein
MIFLKQRHFAFIILCLAIFFIAGCEFDDPYVPEYASSSTLTRRIVTDPLIELDGIEVLLRGQSSFAAVTDADGTFHFRDIPPDDYSLHVQKKPYLRDSFSVSVEKSTDEDMGKIKVELKGAIVGTIPNNKVSIIQGEVEVIVYIDGIPLVMQQDDIDDFTIDLSSTESNISIEASTKITIYIDGVTYPGTVQDEGSFIVEFVPPGIYSDIRVKLNSKEENTFPIVSGRPVVIKNGQTRFLTPENIEP